MLMRRLLQIRMLTDFGKTYEEKEPGFGSALFSQPNSPTTSANSPALVEAEPGSSSSLRQGFGFQGTFTPQSSPSSSPGFQNNSMRSAPTSSASAPDPPHDYNYHFDAKLIVTEEFPDDGVVEGSNKRKWRRAVYRCTYPCVSWNARAHSWLVYYEDAEGRKSKTFNPKKLGRFYHLQPEVRDFLMGLDVSPWGLPDAAYRGFDAPGVCLCRTSTVAE